MDDSNERKFQKDLNGGLVGLVLLAVLADSDEDLYGYEIAKRLADANTRLAVLIAEGEAETKHAAQSAEAGWYLAGYAEGLKIRKAALQAEIDAIETEERGAPVIFLLDEILHGTNSRERIIGACAVLAFAGLVGRLAGGRWAPAGALVLAISLPEQYTSRNTFSETLAQVMLFGGLCMLADSFVLPSGRHAAMVPVKTSWRDGPAPTVALAFFGGLAVGLTLLIRIDGISDLLPAIPFLGILLLTRRAQALPFGLGLVIGALTARALGPALLVLSLLLAGLHHWLGRRSR